MSGALTGTKDACKTYAVPCSVLRQLRDKSQIHSLPTLYRLLQQVSVEQLLCAESCIQSSEDEKKRDWGEIQP